MLEYKYSSQKWDAPSFKGMAMKGILDFLEMFANHETDPNFAFYAVKAPFTDVTQKFFARHDHMMREQNAPKH